MMRLYPQILDLQNAYKIANISRGHLSEYYRVITPSSLEARTLHGLPHPGIITQENPILALNNENILNRPDICSGTDTF